MTLLVLLELRISTRLNYDHEVTGTNNIYSSPNQTEFACYFDFTIYKQATITNPDEVMSHYDETLVKNRSRINLGGGQRHAVPHCLSPCDLLSPSHFPCKDSPEHG